VAIASQHPLLGTSPSIRRLVDAACKVGRSRVPVLIQGESGTGKELVARTVYAVQPQGEFVPIDCGSLSPALLESELFGHERGAFTGAVVQRTGLLQIAHGGTAFFDEIGELPPESQAKLLRVLQQKEIRPVGSNRSQACNFRIIAATNRDLAEEVRCGRFRLDLYFRLNVIRLQLPPLREHTTDIPCLIEHFLRKNAYRHQLTPGVLDALMAHQWPGNVRELENCIERLVALSSDQFLHAEDLEFHTGLIGSGSRPPSGASGDTLKNDPLPTTPNPEARTDMHCDQQLSMESAEQTAIQRALARSQGSRSAAAKLLGIGRTTLYRRLLKANSIRTCTNRRADGIHS
jgi:DNA-binding NtrC family response regulator